MGISNWFGLGKLINKGFKKAKTDTKERAEGENPNPPFEDYKNKQKVGSYTNRPKF